jgi:hypothetical protein
LLEHGSLLEPPEKFINSYLLNFYPFHKLDVIFILVEHLLDHVVSHPH